MVLFDLLQMTKTKILVLIALLAMLVTSYVDLGCIEGYCSIEREICTCGFLPLEFFVCFIWAYIFSCLIVESAKATKLRIRRRK
jgi:hypothetical protein